MIYFELQFLMAFLFLLILIIAPWYNIMSSPLSFQAFWPKLYLHFGSMNFYMSTIWSLGSKFIYLFISLKTDSRKSVSNLVILDEAMVNEILYKSSKLLEHIC